MKIYRILSFNNVFREKYLKPGNAYIEILQFKVHRCRKRQAHLYLQLFSFFNIKHSSLFNLFNT